MPEKFDFKKLDLSKESNQKKFDEEFKKLKKEEKDKVVNEAWGESLEMNKKFGKKEEEKLKTVERDEGKLEIETVEKELSPEALKEIMSKAMDINKRGTAFSVISPEYPTPKLESGESKLESILKNGLIGTSPEQPGIDRAGFYNKTNKDIYVDLLKKRIKTEVYFNIIGRTVGDDPWRYKRIDEYGYYFHLPKQTMAVLFDISNFKETIVEGKHKLPEPHFFSVYEGDYGDPSRLDRNENGEILAYSDYGFHLSPRVPPRYFKGIVFHMRRKLEHEEYEKKIKKMLEENIRKKYATSCEQDENWLRKEEKFRYDEEFEPQKLTERASEIAREMLNADKEKLERMIPIYDVRGNMWWPKQMSYEEVKKFAAERDKKKQKSEEK
ncbi:MAG: hypothetical protein Q7S18_02295 [bacterium]|nr:hypothetical protein [bacterium]